MPFSFCFLINSQPQALSHCITLCFLTLATNGQCLKDEIDSWVRGKKDEKKDMEKVRWLDNSSAMVVVIKYCKLIEQNGAKWIKNVCPATVYMNQ